MNTDLLVEFIGPLIAGTQKVFLILDNFKAHHAKTVTRWPSEHLSQIKVFHLPLYTPERAIPPSTSTGTSKPHCACQSAQPRKTRYGVKPMSSCNSCATPQSGYGSFNHLAVRYAT